MLTLHFTFTYIGSVKSLRYHTDRLFACLTHCQVYTVIIIKVFINRSLYKQTCNLHGKNY